MSASLAGRKILLAALLSAKVKEPEAEMAVHAASIVSKGGIVVGSVLQRRGVSRDDRPGGSRRMNAPMNAATYFGAGKVQEIAELRRATGAELVVVCAKLSPSQLANLERIIGCPVLDMTILG
jgi:GTP-binding GTPase N-terminal